MPRTVSRSPSKASAASGKAPLLGKQKGTRTRFQLFVRIFLALLSLWLYAIYHADGIISKQHQAPIIGVIVAGVMAVLNIAYHMVTFRQCPEAHRELMKDIERAKADLKANGFKLDK